MFLFITYWMAKVYEPFLQVIIIASLLAISTSKLNFFFLKYLKSSLISSILSTILLSIIFFVPLIYFLTTFAIYLNNFDKTNLDKFLEYLSTIVNHIPESLNFIKPTLSDFLDKIEISKIVSKSIEFTAYFGKLSATFIKDMLLILIFYLFINIYAKNLLEYIRGAFPLSQNDLNELFNKISNVMGVVFYSIILTAVFEGVLFGAITYYLGFDGVVFGVLYGFASLIPVIGGVIMWLPLGLYELANNNILDALIITFYSIIVISIIADTFIKPLIIKYISDKILKIQNSINEILIFFSIVAGLSTFGFWGMIIGPAITALFISILKLNKKFYE
jgi:predicted PurR-regulated permease PerM